MENQSDFLLWYSGELQGAYLNEYLKTVKGACITSDMGNELFKTAMKYLNIRLGHTLDYKKTSPIKYRY